MFKSDLDSFRQVGQLVDAEDSAIRARKQSVVNGQLIREVAALGDLDRVDLADQVGDRDVWRRELLAISPVAADPRDRHRVSILGDEVETAPADRVVGVIVDLAPGDDRYELVEQADQGPHDPTLGLAALAQHDDVVSRDDGVRQLRQHRFVVADDSREQRLARLEAREKIAPHLLLDRLALVSGGTKLRDGLGSGSGHLCHYSQGP